MVKPIVESLGLDQYYYYYYFFEQLKTFVPIRLKLSPIHNFLVIKKLRIWARSRDRPQLRLVLASFGSKNVFNFYFWGIRNSFQFYFSSHENHKIFIKGRVREKKAEATDSIHRVVKIASLTTVGSSFLSSSLLSLFSKTNL